MHVYIYVRDNTHAPKCFKCIYIYTCMHGQDIYIHARIRYMYIYVIIDRDYIYICMHA